MKLYNTIVIFDVYTIANSAEAARQSALQWIRERELPVSESTAIETRTDNIRSSWRDQKPLVADDVSDSDFESIKGKTAADIWAQLYTKQKG